MAKIDQTQDDLQNELTTQLGFMMKSCHAFDSGEIMEAKRISGSLRILLKDGRNNKFLIGMTHVSAQLISYAETIKPVESGVWVQNNFIVSTLMNPIHQYFPNFLSQMHTQNKLEISNWLDEVIITDTKGMQFSRKRVLLTMAEQDGGAHVDPGIEADYHALVKMNSQQCFFISDIDFDPEMGMPKLLPIDKLKPALPPVWHSIRQMAHEVFESLGVTYPYDPSQFYKGAAFSGIGLM